MDDGPNPAGTRVAPWPRPGWAWVGSGAAVLAATTLLALRPGVRAGEEPVFIAFNDLPRGVGLPLVVLMPLGAGVGALVLVGAALLLRRVRLGVAAFAAWGLGRASSAVLKAWVDRPRPSLLINGVTLRQSPPRDLAFPSAHTTGAVALAVVAAWALPRARSPAVGVAVLVAAARMYVGVHLPLDLLGGAALGLLAGTTATAAIDRWWPVAPSRGSGHRSRPGAHR